MTIHKWLLSLNAMVVVAAMATALATEHPVPVLIVLAGMAAFAAGTFDPLYSADD